MPFGLTAVALLIEAADGVTKDVQYYVLADLVARLLAGVVGVVVWRSSVASRCVTSRC